MPKRSALARAVANYNKRLTREMNKWPEKPEYLPEKLSAREMRRGMGSQAEIDRTVKALNRFQQPQMRRTVTGEKGLTLTRWELGMVQRANRQANAAREAIAAVTAPAEFINRETKIQQLARMPRQVDINRFAGTAAGLKAFRRQARVEHKMGRGGYLNQVYSQAKKDYLYRINKMLGRRGRNLAAAVKGMSPHDVFLRMQDDPFLDMSNLYYDLSDAQISLITEHWQQAAAA